MVDFQDKFDRTDRDLNGDAGWVVDDFAGTATAAAVRISTQEALHFEPTSAYVCRQADVVNKVLTVNQIAEATVVCMVEDPNSYIDVGTHWTSSSQVGFFARLECRVNGDRYLSIWQNLDVGADKKLAEVQVADSNLTVDGIAGEWRDSGDPDTFESQKIRIIVTEDETGILVRGYLNQPDDDRPTIGARSRADWIASSPEFGQGWFRFGANGITASQFVGWFRHADYESTRLTGAAPDNSLTLGEIERRVKSKHAGAVNDQNLLDGTVTLAIQDALEGIHNECGDAAYFLMRSENLTPTWDSDGFYTAPVHMRRILEWRIRATNTDDSAHIQFYGYTSDGRLRYARASRSFVASPEYTVQYLIRQTRPSQPWDVIFLPVEHAEVLVWGAIVRLSQEDRSADWVRSAVMSYQRLLKALKKDLARHGDQRRVRIGPQRSRRQIHRGRRFYYQ